MVRISRRLVPVLWLSLIASPRCNNRPRAPTSSPLRMVCRQQWNHTIHVDQRHSLNNAKQLKNVSRKLWSLVRNCNRPFPSFRVPLFWCSGRDAWLCGHWEMWKKLFRSYGNVYYVGYHIGGSRGTVERECNEIRFMLWAAAAAKKRDRWRQLLSLAQSSTWEQGTEIREVLDSVLWEIGGNIQHELKCRPRLSTQISFRVNGISCFIENWIIG